MNLYLGTNYGHNASAAVVGEDGELKFAVEEGRLIRDKNTSNFPINAIQVAIETVKGEFTGWAEGWNIWNRLFFKGILESSRYGYRNPTYFSHRLKKEILRFSKGWKYYSKGLKAGNNLLKPKFCGHHLAHAFSLLPWGLPAASLILVSDATAERESISTFFWNGYHMRIVNRTYYPYSLGSMYHQLAHHVGFTGRTGPGKLMALSAFGDPVWYNEFEKLCNISNAEFKFSSEYPIWRIDNTWYHYANRTQNLNLREEIFSCKGNYENAQRLAASMQKFFTETSLKLIVKTIEKLKMEQGIDVSHIGLVGGAALNCQANAEIIRRLKKNQGIKSLIVSPWSDDSGTSIGSAIWLAHKLNSRIKFQKANALIGTQAFSNEEIADEYIDAAADALASNKIIGLVNGKLEFGPRALGARCILASARDKNNVTRINEMKGRPDFMPFAPVVLEEDCLIYFDEMGSENMGWTVYAKQMARDIIPAAIHNNNEARVQVIFNCQPEWLYKLLRNYKKKTGIGVLLLTSLNGKEEAIPAIYSDAETIAKQIGCDGILSSLGFFQLKE